VFKGACSGGSALPAVRDSGDSLFVESEIVGSASQLSVGRRHECTGVAWIDCDMVFL